jgi:hypothetical protein
MIIIIVTAVETSNLTNVIEFLPFELFDNFFIFDDLCAGTGHC